MHIMKNVIPHPKKLFNVILFLSIFSTIILCGCIEEKPDYITIKITNRLPYDVLIWLDVDGYSGFTSIVVKTNETKEPVANEMIKFKRGVSHDVGMEYRRFPYGKWSEKYTVNDVREEVHFIINRDGSVEKYKK